MASVPMNAWVHELRRAALLPNGGGLTDAALLDRFIDRQDEAAFEALVRRHGPMVLGVCRRVIGNHHDAEDAFQATFLVLVRKAATVRPRELVGHWLYGVAYRTALEARSRIARRRAKEQRVYDLPEPEAEPDSPWQELRPLLDRELAGLPERYRLPVVLCDLEGGSRRDVARRLKVPEGTLSSRLARGRRLLARRLSRHGLAVTGGTLAGFLTKHGASAAVPGRLVHATARAGTLLAAGRCLAGGAIPGPVAVLTEGVLKTMLLMKLKNVWSGLLLVVVIGLAAVVLAQQTPTAERAAPPERAAAAAEAAPVPSQAPLRRQLQAMEWAVTKVEVKERRITVDQSVAAPSTLVQGWQTVEPPLGLRLDALPLTRDAKIVIRGKEAKLTDLEPGSIVSLKFAADRLAVRQVTQVAQPYRYLLKALDLKKRTITVRRAREQGTTLESLPLAKDVQVIVNDQAAKLADLKVETPLAITLSADRGRLVVIAIWVSGGGHLNSYLRPR
jgi:RNA polymerase sigma factor (sigma-70 family)